MSNMNIRDLDFNLLIVFDALAKERNVTRAAQHIGVSQPAFSNALSRLRSSLDDPLFVKTSHGMEPTAYANQLIEPIQQSIRLIEEALSKKQDFDCGRSAKTFMFAATDYTEVILLPRIMEWLSNVAPNINVRARHLRIEEMKKQIEAGTVDLALGPFPDEVMNLYQQTLFQDRHICIVRKKHPTIKNKLSLQQFVEGKHALVSPQGKDGGFMDGLLKDQGLERRVGLQVSHFSSIPMIVAQTDLISTISERIVRQSPYLSSLRVLPPPFDLEPTPIKQYWHARSHNSPENQWLRSNIFELFQNI